MQLPGTPSLVFLFYLVVFLPWAALRSARKLQEAREASAGDLSRILSGYLIAKEAGRHGQAAAQA